MKRWQTWGARIFLGLSLLILSGCGEPKAAPYGVKLEIWGVFDDSDALRDVLSEYRQLNPYVRDITYRKLDPDTYKADLLNALAAGTGPDIFMLRNTWQAAFADKVIPAPTAQINEKAFRESFVDVAADDFLTQSGEVLAVPLSVDSLALYYNKDLFNAAGITEPPKTWEELVPMVRKLTHMDAFGTIDRSAIAFGTGSNINRSSDVVLALMAQMGSTLDNNDFDNGQAAEKALSFYTQFAKLGSPLLTWSQRSHYSIDAFYEGTLAMTVNYSYHADTFRQKNAKLNFAVAPLPQFAGQPPVNFANYWGLAVTKNKNYVPDSADRTSLSADAYQKARVHEAWQLLRYLALRHPNSQFTFTNALTGTTKIETLQSDPTQKYLELTHKPAARRDLIEGQKSDRILAPFAEGNLIARSWYPGVDPEAADLLLVDAIKAVNRGERTVNDALSVFQSRLERFRR